MQALTIILLRLTAVIGFGAEPPTQMATLRWSGDGEFMSWRWEKLGEAFEDGAAQFAAESRIVSPTWASFATGAEEVDDSAGRGESVALGWREADVECGFELIAEFDQVERVPSEVVDKGGVEAHLRRREVEVPCDDGLDACLNRSFHLPSSLPHKCQGNVNKRGKSCAPPTPRGVTLMKPGGAGTGAQNQFIANRQPYHSDRITRVSPSDSPETNKAPVPRVSSKPQLIPPPLPRE